MPNQYFQFKQFIVNQGLCAMKVTTDSCLFGAVVADYYTSALPPINNMLDVGTGTGLLSLMFAQKNALSAIDAIETDTAACQQATENFAASPWADRLKLHNKALQIYTAANAYNLIVCNPPFYENQLHSKNSKKNSAHHSTELLLEELFYYCNALLVPSGCLAMLLPFYRQSEAIILAENNNLSSQRIINVQQTCNHAYFRSILFFSKFSAGSETSTEEIVIKNNTGEYSTEFRQFLDAYYLHL